MATAERNQYDGFATEYASYGDVPDMKLEIELVRTALGDCTGLTVLDLGGGSGLHARSAAELGATLVDVVDISAEMLRVGQELEETLGRRYRIRYLQADAARPLVEQIKTEEFKGRYDIVMANWLLDHATSEEDLRGMWTNIASALKPGGRFIGVRVRSIRAPYLQYGKYGVIFSEYEEIPGPGWKYKVSFKLNNTPVSFEATSMESTLNLDHTIPKELGLDDFSVVPDEESKVVKEDFEYWADHLKDPSFVVVVGTKK
ncbi:S-adenosyl-L-methionine-dependent methyltransferase [Apiosordaria backusii]|uniref:S-adenosyl-L-methionine-dependent methyltransferase n=1 Tax=Apiosordaria backusii TaxID=314023 RepID=A0AA40BLY0_9PEZI|nr:S-adenosyl-L-methionine-dependent methyltransferase [Apiosordaria backusii]